MLALSIAGTLAILLATSNAGGLENIDHVIFFMQENLAFDHYFGTMAGVRGFKDPNVLQGSSGKPIWYQPTNKTSTGFLLPWWLSQDQGYAESNQCSVGGSNGWEPNHKAWSNGTIEGWATMNTPYSWGHFRGSDLPVHFNFSETWTIGDMYAEAVIGPTWPNRLIYNSGTINVPGALPGQYEVNGGFSLDNSDTVGCETASGVKYSCFPYNWTTTPEYLEAADIDWFVFQDKDNFGTNMYADFTVYRDDPDSELNEKANSFTGLEAFFNRAANGSLPAVTFIYGPAELSEHPPYMPKDGAWFQRKLIDAVARSPKYPRTALFITYDETGGYGDHVPPFTAPRGTGSEWVKDPLNANVEVPWGPGFRVPFYVISPWTRGGNVFSEPADHHSHILFLEEWAKAKYGKDITHTNVSPWRRDHMSNLVNVFDFDNPDYSSPVLMDADTPESNGQLDGWTGTSTCQAKYNNRKPPVPSGNQSESDALWTEQGFKQLRGALTEGRYLVFQAEESGSCVSRNGDDLQLHTCGQDYGSKALRYIVHQVGDAFSDLFTLQQVDNGKYIGLDGHPTVDRLSAVQHTISYERGRGYTVYSQGDDSYWCENGTGQLKFCQSPAYFKLFSVTYDD